MNRKPSLPYSIRIGQFYKSYREKARLSQNDLAVELKVNKQLVSNWERGMCSPKASHVSLLVKMCKIPKAQLLSLLLETTEKEYRKIIKI
jgi:transcriptional regulator with XRE-family HTH domain